MVTKPARKKAANKLEQVSVDTVENGFQVRLSFSYEDKNGRREFDDRQYVFLTWEDVLSFLADALGLVTRLKVS